MKIALGSDHAGYALRKTIGSALAALGHEILDCGCPDENSCDYPDYAAAAARSVASGDAERGVLVCGTGIGVSIAANKIPGVRAALVHDRNTARYSREHNDANVLCLGARVLDARHAVEITLYWITIPFEGGRHARRVAKMDALLPAEL